MRVFEIRYKDEQGASYSEKVEASGWIEATYKALDIADKNGATLQSLTERKGN